MEHRSMQSLYETYQTDVYYYLLGLTHNQITAEDLTSETFLAAMRALPSFRGASSIKTWLFSIARNQWCAYIRKEKKQQNLLEQLALSDIEISPEDCVTTQEITRRIFTLLDTEPDRAKRVVLLRLEGYSFLEIGEKIGISETSARVLEFRTRKKLREILAKEGFSHG